MSWSEGLKTKGMVEMPKIETILDLEIVEGASCVKEG